MLTQRRKEYKHKYNQENRSYISEYNSQKYDKGKQDLIFKLGGKCNQCGSIDRLEIDHINPKTKSFNILHKLNCIITNEIENELKKCQLLCYDCHSKKHSRVKILEHGGGLKGIRNCKCYVCKLKRAEYDSNRRRG